MKLLLVMFCCANIMADDLGRLEDNYNNTDGNHDADVLNCEKNEEIGECGRECENTCAFIKMSCSLKCSSKACVCKKGYYRDSKGNCTNDCRKEECAAPNMERKRCAKKPDCQNTCVGKVGSVKFCKDACVPYGCECKSGFLLLEPRYDFPQCVTEKECKVYLWKRAQKFD
ncbi:unnamed protein product, partial [Cylicocyclus nassatus]